MAASLSLSITQNSQSIPNNTSNVTVRLTISWTYGSYNANNRSGYVVIDGTQYDFSAPFNSSATTSGSATLWTKTLNIAHNPNGTKTLSTSASYSTGVSSGVITDTASKVLTTIIAKSTAGVTASVEVNGTNQVTATITRYDPTYTHTVTFYIGTFGGTYSQSYTNVATSQAYAVPLAWMNAIPNAYSGVAKVRIETFDGATSLGYNEYNFTINVPLTVIPVVTNITFARDTTGTDPFGAFAKGHSKVSVSAIAVTNQYSATPVTFKTYLHLASESYLTGKLYTGSAFVSDVINQSGTMRLTTIVTDSRTRESAVYYEDFTVYDYFSPSLTVDGVRCDSAGVTDPSGDYISARISVNVAPVNNDNTKTYVLEYKKTTDSVWTAISTSALTGYSGILTGVRSASSSFSWEVRASITDKVGTVTKTAQVSTASTVMDFLSGGLGMAIGKVSENEGLETAWKIFGHGLDLTEVPFSYTSTAAVNTTDKGTFDGVVFLNQIIDVKFDNGNTVAAPTITIGAVEYTFSGIPIVAQYQSGSAQTYRFKKTAATTLTFVTAPNYCCETCIDGEWTYERYADGKAKAWGLISGVTVANAAAFGTGGLYTLYGTGTIPTGFFNAAPVGVGSYYNAAASLAGSIVYIASSTSYGVHCIRTTNATSAVIVNMFLNGTWK